VERWDQGLSLAGRSKNYQSPDFRGRHVDHQIRGGTVKRGGLLSNAPKKRAQTLH